MPALRPRRRATAETTVANTSVIDEGTSAAGRASPDSEEVRQSAAVLEMLASKSQARPNEEDEGNVKLSQIIASVIEKQTTPQKPPKASTRPKRQAARKTPVAVKQPRSEAPARRSRRRISQPQSEPPLRRSRRRTKISVEVTVTTSDEEEGADEAERAADFFSRQSAADMLDDSDAATGYDMGYGAVGSSLAPAAPKFYEMTPQLLESLMAPVGLFQSPSEDGTEKELRLRMPVDYGGGCVGVCDILFNEHLGVRIDGATDWMPVHFIGDYLDPESVQVADTVLTETEESITYAPVRATRAGRHGARDTSSSHIAVSQSSLGCKEEVHRIASLLEMETWMAKVVKSSSSSDWVLEHDYAEPMIKFGRPRSANILQDAVSAFNKYVNFIRLSERREPFLFGLWWEKEDMHADYWLLPKPKEEDADYDRRHAMMVIPIANEWTEEVVVSSEETVDFNGMSGAVTPMTFWDNRGFLSATSLNGSDGVDYSAADASFNPAVAAEESFFKRPDASSSSKPRKRTTATPVARAPRFLAPKLDPSVALLSDGKFNENGMPENLDEIVNTIQNQAHLYESGDMAGLATGASSGYSNRNRSTATATGSHLKNLSKEKLDEIDFAMRCIKELQQRRYSGPCRLHCKICSREFTAPTSLIVHYRSHAGIKPFTCPICLTSFTRRHSLKYHMLCHSGQARFRCNLCDRLFRHSGHYRDHMRKHEHGMPFSCTECNRVFATRTTFRRHMAVVHNSADTQKGKGRSVGVSKLYADMEGIDELEAGELGEVAEEIEYEGEEDDDMDSFAAEEVVEG